MNFGVLGVILEAWRQPGAPKSSPETPREHTRAPSRPPGSLPEAALSERTPILGSPQSDFRNYVNLLAYFVCGPRFSQFCFTFGAQGIPKSTILEDGRHVWCIVNNGQILVFQVFVQDGFQDPFWDPPGSILDPILGPFWRPRGPLC